MNRLKAVGERGSWYATVQGERLPCVHQANMHPDGMYRARKVSDASHDQLLAAIKSAGKVIVRKSVRQSDSESWVAKGYVAVFEVADPEIVNDEFRFRFVRRIAELQD